jgi:hypothetical protein
VSCSRQAVGVLEMGRMRESGGGRGCNRGGGGWSCTDVEEEDVRSGCAPGEGRTMEVQVRRPGGAEHASDERGAGLEVSWPRQGLGLRAQPRRGHLPRRRGALRRLRRRHPRRQHAGKASMQQPSYSSCTARSKKGLFSR